MLSGILDQLEHHNKELHEDVAELMEVCETMEFANRAMIRDCHVSCPPSATCTHFCSEE